MERLVMNHISVFLSTGLKVFFFALMAFFAAKPQMASREKMAQ